MRKRRDGSAGNYTRPSGASGRLPEVDGARRLPALIAWAGTLELVVFFGCVRSRRSRKGSSRDGSGVNLWFSVF